MTENRTFETNLDPEVEKIRDQIISKIGDKPLEEVNKIIKKLLMENMDETMRLAALAARVKIIRGKIALLYDRKVQIKPNLKTKIPTEEKIIESKRNETRWVRIKMLEAGEVNGKQIDKDVILDVKEEDSKILIDAKKAEIIKENAENAEPISKAEPLKKETPPKESENLKDSEKKENVKDETTNDTNIEKTVPDNDDPKEKKINSDAKEPKDEKVNPDTEATKDENVNKD